MRIAVGPIVVLVVVVLTALVVVIIAVRRLPVEHIPDVTALTSLQTEWIWSPLESGGEGKPVHVAVPEFAQHLVSNYTLSLYSSVDVAIKKKAFPVRFDGQYFFSCPGGHPVGRILVATGRLCLVSDDLIPSGVAVYVKALPSIPQGSSSP